MNHSYEDTDVYVSMAKLKNHETCGITLSLKNVFGTFPRPSMATMPAWMNRMRTPPPGAAPWGTRESGSLRNRPRRSCGSA